MPFLDDIRQQLRWQDIADILVLTLVVFRLYTWLRGTMALRIGLGMLLLVGAAFAADELGLLLTAYVLQAIGAVATLVVVVIFGDEIRRALSRVNPLRWWRERRAAPADRSAFAALSRAVFALAHHRLGALIVLAREHRVDGHLTGGVVLDALPSTELLEAIFHVTRRSTVGRLSNHLVPARFQQQLERVQEQRVIVYQQDAEPGRHRVTVSPRLPVSLACHLSPTGPWTSTRAPWPG